MCFPSGAQPRTLWFDRSGMSGDSLPVWRSNSESPSLVAQAMYCPSGENTPPGDGFFPIAFSSFAEPSATATSIMSRVPSVFTNSASTCLLSGDHANGNWWTTPSPPARRTRGFEPSSPTTRRSYVAPNQAYATLLLSGEGTESSANPSRPSQLPVVGQPPVLAGSEVVDGDISALPVGERQEPAVGRHLARHIPLPRPFSRSASNCPARRRAPASAASLARACGSHAALIGILPHHALVGLARFLASRRRPASRSTGPCGQGRCDRSPAGCRVGRDDSSYMPRWRPSGLHRRLDLDGGLEGHLGLVVLLACGRNSRRQRQARHRRSQRRNVTDSHRLYLLPFRMREDRQATITGTVTDCVRAYASNRYPRPRTLSRYRGCDGSGSIFFRSETTGCPPRGR